MGSVLSGRNVRKVVHGTLGLGAAHGIASALAGSTVAIVSLGVAPILLGLGAVAGTVYVVDKLLYPEDKISPNVRETVDRGM
jgi:hypothetical protein